MNVGSAPASLAVVIPMANEKASAVPLLREVVAQIACMAWFDVFVVFDRTCTDGTIDHVRDLAKDEPAIKVIWAPENRSLVDAYLRGYQAALASGAAWILEFDAGYSHLPAEIPAFLAAMTHGYDCALGSRFCAGGQMVGASWNRYLASRGGTLLTNLLIGTHLHDMTSGFQMFRREALERILANGLRSRGPFFQTEMKVYARDMQVAEIPIHYKPGSQLLRDGALVDAFAMLMRLFGDRLRGRLASGAGLGQVAFGAGDAHD